MEISREELNLFPTPVSLYDLSYLDMDVIIENIENAEKREFPLLDNGVTTYDLIDRFLDRPDILELKESIEYCLADFTKRLGYTHLHLHLTSSWSNITDIGGKLELHRHESSIVSGVFHPKVDEPIKPLLFKDPLMLDHDIWVYKMAEEYDFPHTVPYPNFFDEIPITSGLLVLFPGWLEHKTDKEIGRRSCISFNTRFTHRRKQ
tara:strand:+ start:44 stop:658 length:615 start_codon:yes stop_codon:yes gene_type:complete